MPPSHDNTMPHSESGASLLIAMVILLVLTLSAFTAMYLAKTETEISGNLAYREAALQSTSLALNEAIAYINGLPRPAGVPSSLPAWFYDVSAPGSIPIDAKAKSAAWATAQSLALSAEAQKALKNGNIFYFIEYLGQRYSPDPGDSLKSNASSRYFYRISIRATGTQNTRAVTQVVYKTP